MPGFLTGKALFVASFKILKWLSSVLYLHRSLNGDGGTWLMLKKKRNYMTPVWVSTHFKHRKKELLWNHFDIENQGPISELGFNVKLLISISWFNPRIKFICTWLSLLSITSHFRSYERMLLKLYSLSSILIIIIFFYFWWHLTHLSHSKASKRFYN